MDVRFAQGPDEVSKLNTEQLRKNFLIDLIQPDYLNLMYSHYDRLILGGACPKTKELELPNPAELRANYFLERREIGIINVGGAGIVEAGNEKYNVNKLDAVYLGKGTEKVILKSADASKPAVFYLLSSPAHQTYPNRLLTKEQATPTEMGELKTANKRTIYKYIFLDGIKSCQLVMGLTVLAEGSVWNTMPAHTHTRRAEAYFYFDVPENHRVVHFMGEPTETRHLFVSNYQAIISPPWSIHSGSGTSNYSFIWGMCGENLVYTDMDAVPIPELR